MNPKQALKRAVRHSVGQPAYDRLVDLWSVYQARHDRARHSHPRTCPICGYEGKFHSYGVVRRPDAECPKCRGLERHRLLYFYLVEGGINRLDGKEILHFAPEPFVRGVARGARRYVTAEIVEAAADLQLDVTNISFDSASFDVVICNHVLEHVPDDRRALSEIYRVLRRGGLSILTVPLVEGWDRTYENSSLTSEADRDLHFGQKDHVRYYGRDFADRIAGAGFVVSVFQIPQELYARHALLPGDKIFIGHKS